MLGSTLPFQASFPLTCSRLLFPVTPVVTSGLPLSPACPVLLARLSLGSWTPGCHLTSSLGSVEPVAHISRWWVECSLLLRGQTSVQKAFPASQPSPPAQENSL